MMDDQTTTGSPDTTETTTTGYEDETTTFEIPADAARQDEFGPIIEDSLEQNWEEKEVVLRLRPNQNRGCNMDHMEDDQLFINVFSTIVSTLTQYETVTQVQTSQVVFKSEGGCFPQNAQELFTTTCANL